MFRFTIRDVLMLTALVAICVTWLMDRDKIRRERAELVKREAELKSQRNVAIAEAKRADLREMATSEYNQRIMMALRTRGMDPQEVLDMRSYYRDMETRRKAARAAPSN
jgi:hypothetical protein